MKQKIPLLAGFFYEDIVITKKLRPIIINQI